MPAAHGFIAPVSWTHFWGTLTDADIEGYLRHQLEQAQSASREGRQVLVLMLHYKSGAPDAGQRRMLAEAIEEHGEKMADAMPLFAYVFDSSIARGVVTAINWLVKKPFTEQIFSTPTEALQSLALKDPRVDVDAVWRDIEAKVPADRRFPR